MKDRIPKNLVCNHAFSNKDITELYMHVDSEPMIMLAWLCSHGYDNLSSQLSLLLPPTDLGLWPCPSHRYGDDGVCRHTVLAGARDYVELDALWDAGGPVVCGVHRGRTPHWASALPWIRSYPAL